MLCVQDIVQQISHSLQCKTVTQTKFNMTHQNLEALSQYILKVR